MGPARAVKYLLDTHIWHRAIHDTKRAQQPLSAAVMRILADEPGELTLCDVSLLELARHMADAGDTESVCAANLTRGAATLRVLPITPAIAVRSYLLDWPKKYGGGQHCDPADRLIVATAMVHGLMLVTEDAEIHHRAPHWRLPVLR
jgi:PIN domain nuclease of toxin-antitoxin system